MSKLHLVSKQGCPFAERTQIVLTLKQVDYRLTIVDLEKKPEWFLESSPLGKVPLLFVGEEVLVESTILNEYLEDLYPVPRLLAADPAAKAQARYWILFDETRLVPAFYRLVLAQERGHQERAAKQFDQELKRFVEGALTTSHDFIGGDTLELADITLFTHLRRLKFVEPYRNLGPSASAPKLQAWLHNVEKEVPVTALASDDIAGQDLRPYLEGTARGATVDDLSAAD